MAFCYKYPGGTEVESSILFVDVRGSTGLAERMRASDYSRLMNRFYKAATDVLIRTDAYIDQFVGDEAVGLYFPLFTGPNHARAAVGAAQELLRVMGYCGGQQPWLPIGVGVHTGVVFFGTVSGSEGSVTDVAALGDNVNTTARLASKAASGEALISDEAYAAADLDPGDLEHRQLELKGKNEPLNVRVLCAAPALQLG
jgi:adenylate cyclase